MKKFLLILASVVVAATLASCNKEPNPGNDPATPDNPTPPAPPTPEVTDLSKVQTSNCYVIDAEGEYSFNATVRGNGATTEGLDAPTAIAPEAATLVWESAKGMITKVSFEDGKISFKASNAAGNALIAAVDDQGTILWSWHIWRPSQPIAEVEAKSGYTIMNMNLGAMKATFTGEGDAYKTYGLLYQWGRKDPFTASPTTLGTTATVGSKVYGPDGKEVAFTNSSWSSIADNTIEYSIANPTVCLSHYAQYSTSRDWLAADNSNDALWGNPKGGERDEHNDYPNKGAKSFYDPCPVGWRVPPVDVFRYVTTSGGYSEDSSTYDIADLNKDGATDAEDFNFGWSFNMKEGSSFFPATARYDGSYGMLYGSVSGMWGNYWGNAPGKASVAGYGYAVLSFQKLSLSPAASGQKADAYAIRCVKE